AGRVGGGAPRFGPGRFGPARARVRLSGCVRAMGSPASDASRCAPPALRQPPRSALDSESGGATRAHRDPLPPMTASAVSVLMTSYNREKYIAAAIRSVLAQTFRDFELIVVDDGSTDRSLEIARAFERRDSRIRVAANDRNLGDYPNRNRAAELASAPLMKYHDSDDLMYPHCLEVMVAMLSAQPTAGFGLSIGLAWSGGPCPMLLTPRLAYPRGDFGPGLFNARPSDAHFLTA